MEKTLTIKFGKSSSQNYDYAVELAKKNDSYTQQGEGKNISHTVIFRADQLDNFFELYDLVGRWKSTRVYIDNELLPPNKTAFLWCYKECMKSFNPNEYCYGRDDGQSYNDNDFGCRHTGINLYNWNGLSGYGTIDNVGTFNVNKDKLIHDILKNIDDYKYCPMLNIDKVKQGLNKIPDRINPNILSDWEYVTNYENGKTVAKSVRKKDKSNSFIVEDNADRVIEIKIDPDTVKREVSKNSTFQKSNKPQGCAMVILSIILIPIVLYLII